MKKNCQGKNDYAGIIKYIVFKKFFTLLVYFNSVTTKTKLVILLAEKTLFIKTEAAKMMKHMKQAELKEII